MKKANTPYYVLVGILCFAISFPWIALNLFGATTPGIVDKVETETAYENKVKTRSEKIKYSYYVDTKRYSDHEKIKGSWSLPSCNGELQRGLNAQFRVRVVYCKYLPFISRIACIE